MLERAGVAPAQRRFERSVDARYPRQSHELAVPVAARPIGAAALAQIAADFHTHHLHTYGHDNRSEPVQIVSVRVAAIGATASLAIRDAVARSGTDAVKTKRQVWFRETGVIDATIYDRKRMAARLQVTGPAVIESLESTILVPPGWRAEMNEDGFVLLTRVLAGATQQ
jgi:N-methylhydantoinase A